jgi:hypothetical protein
LCVVDSLLEVETLVVVGTFLVDVDSLFALEIFFVVDGLLE